jgi:hypothetical protein
MASATRGKRSFVTIGVAFLALAALMTPASAVSEEARRACERAADRQLPILTATEKEAFIANCLANASATPGGTQGGSKY